MLVVLALLIALAGAVAQKDDASCYSRFDYESKMLERIVMVEHRMNVLQEATKRDLDQFGVSFKRMKKEQAEHFRELMQKFDVLQGKLQTAQGIKLTELTTIGDDLKNVSKSVMNDQNLKNEELDVKFENMSKHVQDEIAKNHNQLVSDVKVFTDDLDTKYKVQLDTMTAVEYDMKELGENLKEEQSLKLQTVEAVGVDIKLYIQERMIKLEEADTSQKVEYAKVLQEFKETVNNTWDTIKDSGLGMKPNVAFDIVDVTNSRPANGETLKFSNAFINTDSVYDISTGIFTAPVNGTYWFSVQVCGNSNYPVGFRIVLNGKQELSQSSTIQVNYACMTSNAVANLQSGNTVSVNAANSHGSSHYYYEMISTNANARSAFMGALVH